MYIQKAQLKVIGKGQGLVIIQVFLSGWVGGWLAVWGCGEIVLCGCGLDFTHKHIWIIKSLSPSYALQLASFPWYTAAEIAYSVKTLIRNNVEKISFLPIIKLFISTIISVWMLIGTICPFHPETMKKEHLKILWRLLKAPPVNLRTYIFLVL